MTPRQMMHSALQLVENETDAYCAWTMFQSLLSDSAFILSVPGPSPFPIKMKRRFGRRARLVGLFADDDLFFLYQRLHRAIEEGHDANITLTYSVCFDTNIASQLRLLFQDRHTDFADDLRDLLRHFRGHRINWQLMPYLTENADAISKGANLDVIRETILAVERIQDIDSPHFLSTGQIRHEGSLSVANDRAQRRIDKFAADLGSETYEAFRARQQLVFVSVLAMALQQFAWPSNHFASRKIKGLVRFMDQELGLLNLEVLQYACEWYQGGKLAGIFSPLNSNSRNLLQKARNISWDLFHLMQMRLEPRAIPKSCDFVIPYLLTFDQALADLLTLSAVKGCLMEPAYPYPLCFPKTDPEALLLRVVGDDPLFLEEYFSPEANARRITKFETGARPDLSGLQSKLEIEVSAYELR